MSGTDQTKAALAALADGATSADSPRDDYKHVIDRADAARDDLEAAAAFLETFGRPRLDRAVEAAERAGSDRAATGRAARAAFERYRRAAAGDHFHRARDTSLGGAGVRPDE